MISSQRFQVKGTTKYNIGEALRLLRAFSDLKAKDLAVSLGISPNYMCEIEKGKKKPNLSILELYANFYDIKISLILRFAEEIGIKF